MDRDEAIDKALLYVLQPSDKDHASWSPLLPAAFVRALEQDGHTVAPVATIATLRAVEQAARDVWDTCPASYDPADPLVIQHAHALNVLSAALAQAKEATDD
jgi:broad specificity phosphatase PhoE